MLVLADIGRLPAETADCVQPVGGERRRAGALRGAAPGAVHRTASSRCGCARAAALWAAPQLGDAAGDSQAFPETSPFAGLAMPTRRRHHPPGPCGARRRTAPTASGPTSRTARRWSPAGARQGNGRPLPRHRQCRLVQPAAVRPLRGDAAADRRCVRLRLNPGAGVPDEATAEAVAPLRILNGFGDFGPPPSTAKPLPAHSAIARRRRPRRPASTARRTVRSPSTRGWPPTQSRRPTHRPERAPRQLRGAEPRDLRGILLSAAVALFLIDAVWSPCWAAASPHCCDGARQRQRWRSRSWAQRCWHPPGRRANSRRRLRGA